MKVRPSVAHVLTVIFIVVLLGLSLKQQTELRRMTAAYRQLQEEREQRRPAAAASRPENLPAVPGEGDAQNASVTGETVTDPALEAASPHPRMSTPATERNRLKLTGVDVKPGPKGLIATLRFDAVKTGPLGTLALAVRLPRGTDSKILDLDAFGSAVFDDFSKTVSEDGKFAFFQGEMGNQTNAQIALSVSGSGTAYVTGSCGIESFEVPLQPPARAR